MVEEIKQMEYDLLGFQEPFKHQIDDLKEKLSDYEYFEAADSAGFNHGIFFLKTTLNV